MNKNVLIGLCVACLIWFHVSCGSDDTGSESPDTGGTTDTGETTDTDTGGDTGTGTEAQTTSSITQYGITWTFDNTCEYGQFANGDYWVVGPVTITSITPDFNGSNNGWEVNPVPNGQQGFECGAQNFYPELVPDLPYTATPGESIVKSISKYEGTCDDCYPVCLQTAAVLTVVDSPPPDDGASVFRPPYVGDDKPYYATADIHTDRLPILATVADAPSLDWVVERFKRVQLQHEFGRMGRIIRPEDNMDDYGPNNATDENDAILRLMLEDSVEAKMPGLIALLQHGIDSYHAVLNGQTWPSGGGYEPGHKLVLTFAAALFDSTEMENAVINADFFHEDLGVYRSSVTDMALYGFTAPMGSYKTRKDPEEIMDAPGAGYIYCCLAMPWKGAVLSVRLMPAMQDIWYGAEWEELAEFIDRWVDTGRYYPAPQCEGQVSATDIPLCDLHETDANDGYRVTDFQHTMWDTYR